METHYVAFSPLLETSFLKIFKKCAVATWGNTVKIDYKQTISFIKGTLKKTRQGAEAYPCFPKKKKLHNI